MKLDLFNTLGTVGIAGGDIAIASDDDGDYQADDGKEDDNTDQTNAWWGEDEKTNNCSNLTKEQDDVEYLLLVIDFLNFHFQTFCLL